MSTSPTWPGVYIEELLGGVRTVTGVASSVRVQRALPPWFGDRAGVVAEMGTQSQPAVQIRIGRVVVRAETAARRTVAPPVAPPASRSLADYLAAREERPR